MASERRGGAKRILFIAPRSNLKTTDEILASATEQTVTICAGDVDRAKGERYLRDEQDGIHFIGHGDLSILDWSDGPIEVDDLLAMLGGQQRLQWVLITACNSTRVGAEIHNLLHCPVVVCQAPIGDEAAVRFSETFYRQLRLGRDVQAATKAGRATLQRLFPTYGDVVTLINGDDMTQSQADELVNYVKQQLAEMQAVLDSMSQRLQRCEAQLAAPVAPPTTWQAWVNMGFGLAASLLLILLLVRLT